ncbi:N-methyl-L-tryptophan oxidase [Zhihengliuella sp. ISTPL4]|uniref:N-methyl-L-tryptophan oxidase n=1 Tax=Zhihengliuella sp. ISTPL4 TaxID=2058657 RepID=UPI000C797D7E|nr:N-methyl-L-tryptophan oxidase [Zhihengliuella sp. ISTPL4]
MEEVAVVGLGAVGSMALWRLALRGVPVVGFERFGPAHSRGSSHGETRMNKIIGDQPAPYKPLAKRADELWHDLERETGLELVVESGGLVIGPKRGPYVTRARRLAEAQSMPYEEIDAAEVRRRYPAHAVEDGDVALVDPHAGYLRSEDGIRAALTRAEALGAETHFGAAVRLVSDDGADGVLLSIDGVERRFRRVVLSAGAWIPQDLPGAVPVAPVRINATWFRPEGGDVPLDAEHFPVFMRELPDGRIGWGFPQVSDRGVKIGLHGRYGTPVADATANDRPVEAAEVRAISAYVRDAFPGLESLPSTAVPCMVTWAPDETFAIGSPRDWPNVVVMSACSGHGFKYAPASGELAAQLALGEEPYADISAFDLTRFEPEQEARA